MGTKKKGKTEYQLTDRSGDDRYRILADQTTETDNSSLLKILDKANNEIFYRDPIELIFSDEYKNFSKEEILRFGFICGQMSIE